MVRSNILFYCAKN